MLRFGPTRASTRPSCRPRTAWPGGGRCYERYERRGGATSSVAVLRAPCPRQIRAAHAGASLLSGPHIVSLVRAAHAWCVPLVRAAHEAAHSRLAADRRDGARDGARESSNTAYGSVPAAARSSRGPCQRRGRAAGTAAPRRPRCSSTARRPFVLRIRSSSIAAALHPGGRGRRAWRRGREHSIDEQSTVSVLIVD